MKRIEVYITHLENFCKRKREITDISKERKSPESYDLTRNGIVIAIVDGDS